MNQTVIIKSQYTNQRDGIMPVTVIFCKTKNKLDENGYTISQEGLIYDAVLDDVYRNPRWYLDNLDKTVAFRVSWANTPDVYITPTLAHRVIRKSKKQKAL